MTKPTDPDDALERINAIRRARSREPVVERDPATVRAEHCQDHAATMAAYWCLAGFDPGIEAATNFAAIKGTGINSLPRAVAAALTAHLGPEVPDRETVTAALAARAYRAGTYAGQTTAAAAVIGMCRLVRETLTDAALEQLTQRLVGGDPDFGLRCRRAAAMAALGQLRDDPAMLSAAVELAIRECREKPALKPSAIFAVAGPIVHAHTRTDGSIDRAALDAALVAEIAAVTSAMVYPDAEIGSV